MRIRPSRARFGVGSGSGERALSEARIARLRRQLARFKRVVIWGHPLHSHTHSYIHEGFARAFRALGAETLWTEDAGALAAVNLADTLFLTEGQVLDGLPLRSDCHYVLHNADDPPYSSIADRVLALQVHALDIRTRYAEADHIEKLNEYTFLEPRTAGPSRLHQPWATDLLPHEFDFDVSFPRPWPRTKARSWIRARRTGPFSAVWVGTIGQGKFGNTEQLAGFRRACAATGVRFVHRTSIDRAEHTRLVSRSLMAPAIVGQWQLEHAYLPCRIFKNISYGRLGITNSPWIQAIFEHEILCRSDTEELFWAASNFVHDRSRPLCQMREVQARHTYVNRIETIMDCLP